ncbi:MAG: type IV secretion system protein [Lysobacteraceae bacterium]
MRAQRSGGKRKILLGIGANLNRIEVMVLAIAESFMNAGGHLLDTLLRPLAATIGELAYFVLIYDFIHDQIQKFGFGLMGRVSKVVGTTALALMTLWVLFQGYRIIAGQSRDSLMALVINSLKAVLIVTAATTFGLAGPDVHDFLTKDLQGSITAIVTGEPNTSIKALIDKNLAWMQVGLSSIDVIKVMDDPNLHTEKTQAMWMVGAGTAGPAMVGGAMLLMYEVALALFVGLGPIFILCLLFDSTKSLFQRWLMYGIGTMFSMAVLAAMVAIATKVVLATAEAFWLSSLSGQLLGIGGSQGMRSIALQEGGIGLLLTVLLVSTPPMVANFFQGTLANFSPFSQVSGGGGGAAPGYRPGEAGYRGTNLNFNRPTSSRPDDRGQATDSQQSPAPNVNPGATFARQPSFNSESVKKDSPLSQTFPPTQAPSAPRDTSQIQGGQGKKDPQAPTG